MTFHGGVVEQRSIRRLWLSRALLVAGLLVGTWLALSLAGGTASASHERPSGAWERDVPDLLGSAVGDVTESLGGALGRAAEESVVRPVAETVVQSVATPVITEVAEPVVQVAKPVVAPVVQVAKPVVAPALEATEPLVAPVLDAVVETTVAPVPEPVGTPATEAVDVSLIPDLAELDERGVTADLTASDEQALPAPSASEPDRPRAQVIERGAVRSTTGASSVTAPSRSPVVPDDGPYGGQPSTPASAPMSSTGLTTGGPGPMLALMPFSSEPHLPAARGPVAATPAGMLADDAQFEPSFSPD